MYPSKGGGGFAGQQTYAAQQAYGQLSGPGFSGNPAAGPEMGAQHALASRQASMVNISQEVDVTGYRTHPTQAAQYGGPYASVYGSAALSSGQQVGGVSSKGAVSSSLQGRAAYPSSLTESSKYPAGALGSAFSEDYISASNRGYAQRGDQFPGTKNSEYAIDRRAYGEGAYTGRDLQSDQARRYADSASLSHQHQTDIHDHMDQALLRQQQIIKAQSLHSGPDIRQAEYLAARAAPIHPGSQEYSSYGGRMDVDPHGLPVLGSSQYGAPHSASILGAPRRNIDDLIYTQGSNAGYGVSLPPGRDYLSGKVLHGPAGSDYQGSIISREHLKLGVPTLTERKDDRDAFHRELGLREEERRRDILREREREKERERDRERERERERERDRRDREREREHRRGLDSRRERTPSRASKDRRASSAKKDERSRHVSPRRSPPHRISPRRVTPRREAVHRHRSPVKEKKREYVCKVRPFCLLEAERDYLSINKRYPRLSISPEFTKVVLKWPKENLHLSLHTPVSFEHDFIDNNKNGEPDLEPEPEPEQGLAPIEDPPKSTTIVWNAKAILMSGVSSDTIDELCSDKSSDDRLIHFNNFLRFAILKKDHSFMAIGGQWKGTLDGAEPSIDGSSLIQTARRYVKDITQLDLQNCQHWNPFLEIHYNRIGNDGLSNYKEITVLFVPDLLECLPTLDTWRSMWLAHRKEIVEKEKALASKKEKKSSEKESIQGDHGSSKSKKASTAMKTGKVSDKSSKDEKISKVDDRSSKFEKISKVVETKDDGGDSKNGTDQKRKLPELDQNSNEKSDEALVGDDRIDDKKALDLTSSDPKDEVKKPVKKKIIRKVVKGMTVGKKATLATDETVVRHDEKSEKDSENKQTDQETVAVINDSSAEPEKAKTFVRKRVVRKVATGKSSQEEDSNATDKKPEQDMKNQEEKTKNDEGLTVDAAQQTPGVKVAGKKRIIRRVIKKKVVPTEDKTGVAVAKDGVQAQNNTSVLKTIKEEELPIVKNEHELSESSLTENKLKEEAKKLAIEKDGAFEKKTNEAMDDKNVPRMDKVSKTEKPVSTNSELETPKHKDSEKDARNTKKEGSRQDKEKRSSSIAKEKDAKHDTKNKSSKETKEKAKSDEPPKQPGLFLKAKKNKGSKVRSLSLSLAGLLEYNDKDTEESTFELSLFAESFNEMLQYQMGCRILSFLEKLRRRFVIKHKQRKRQREEKNEKESEAEAASEKRPKITDKSHAEKKPLKLGAQDSTDLNHDENNSGNEEAPEADKSDQEKKSDVEDVEEELEEMYEEYEEVDETATTNDVGLEGNETGIEEVDAKSKSEDLTNDDQSKENSSQKNSKETETKEERNSSMSKDEKKPSAEKSDLVEEVVDKELLQAFRFFDYNKAGYIKMDDLRFLLHDLGKFLSHRDVKELVQSALYESSSARDDRIFYKKLVRMRDL